jgi:hypothetical protein
MPTYNVTAIIDGKPCFEKPLESILSDLKQGGAIKLLTPLEAITDRQRRWYKGVCIPWLVKQDEKHNAEGVAWWDDEVKRVCNGLALLKKEIFFLESAGGVKVPCGRLTTRGVSKQKMTDFIEEILSKSLEKGWKNEPPRPFSRILKPYSCDIHEQVRDS